MYRAFAEPVVAERRQGQRQQPRTLFREHRRYSPFGGGVRAQATLGPSSTGTMHATPYGYDNHVPMLWLDGAIRPGVYSRPAAVNDIAPTMSGWRRRAGRPAASCTRF